MHSGVLTQWAFAQGGGNSRPGDWAGSWALGRIGPRGAHTRGALPPRARTNRKAETAATAHAGKGVATAGRSRGHGDGQIWSCRVHSGRIRRWFVVGVDEGALVAALTTWKRGEVRKRKRGERKGRGEGRGRPGGARCCSGEQLRRGRRRGLVRELPPLELGDEGAGGDAGAVSGPRSARAGRGRARGAGGGGEC